MTSNEKLIWEIFAELERATEKFPAWPTDPLHALAVVGEEFGELNQAILQLMYEEEGSREHVKEEALQLAAMAIRFVISLDNYRYKESLQHYQGPLPRLAFDEDLSL